MYNLPNNEFRGSIKNRKNVVLLGGYVSGTNVHVGKTDAFRHYSKYTIKSPNNQLEGKPFYKKEEEKYGLHCEKYNLGEEFIY